MNVEKIIDRIPEPRAVQELIAAARDLQKQRDRLMAMLLSTKMSEKLIQSILDQP